MDSFSQGRGGSLKRMMSTKSIDGVSDEGFIDGLGARSYSICQSIRVTPCDARRVSIPITPASPATPFLDTPCTPPLLTPNKISRSPSILDHPSVLSVSQNGTHLMGYMTNLKRSASRSLLNRRVSVVEPTPSIDLQAEVDKLRGELDAREEELVNACEVGQNLVEELEAARAELEVTQDNELKLFDTIDTLQMENTQLYKARAEAQREVNTLKVITDKATEEINILKETVRKTGSMQRRRDEDRAENEQWLLKQAMMQKNETSEEVCVREEGEARVALLQEEEGEVVEYMLQMMREMTLVVRSMHFTKEKKETTLNAECSLLKTKIQAMEVSAEERKIELKEHYAATQQVHIAAVSRRNSCSTMMERATDLVSKIKEACLEYETSLTTI